MSTNPGRRSNTLGGGTNSGYYSPDGTGYSGADFSYSFGGQDDQQFESFDYNTPQQPATVQPSFYDPTSVAPPVSQSYAPGGC